MSNYGNLNSGVIADTTKKNKAEMQFNEVMKQSKHLRIVVEDILLRGYHFLGFADKVKNLLDLGNGNYIEAHGFVFVKNKYRPVMGKANTPPEDNVVDFPKKTTQIPLKKAA